MPNVEKQRTVRDALIEGMQTQGVTDVPCVEFTMDNGAIVSVVTDNHPVLDRPATAIRGMSFKSSAEAGAVFAMRC